MPEWEVQTRNYSGRLSYFETFEAALKYSKRNPHVWKISMELPTGERLRLVRNSDDKFEYEGILDGMG